MKINYRFIRFIFNNFVVEYKYHRNFSSIILINNNIYWELIINLLHIGCGLNIKDGLNQEYFTAVNKHWYTNEIGYDKYVARKLYFTKHFKKVVEMAYIKI